MTPAITPHATSPRRRDLIWFSVSFANVWLAAVVMAGCAHG